MGGAAIQAFYIARAARYNGSTTAGAAPAKKGRSAVFTNRSLRRLILPLIAEQLLTMLVGMADTMMISYAGEAAISGVALVDMVSNLVITLLTSLATGGAVIVSQYLGGREQSGADEAASQLHGIALLVSAGLTALCLLLHGGILRLFFGAVEGDVMRAADTYFLVTALSFPFLGIYNASAALHRSMERTRTTMLVSLLMNAINVAGNAIGIFVLRAGVMGVAVPTLISRAVAGVLMFRLALRRENAVRVRPSRMFARNGAMARRILRIAVPSSVENGLFTLGRVLVTSIVAMFGTSQIAANGVAQSVDMLAIVIVNAMNLAVITVVGQCVGARAYDEAERFLKKLMGVSYAATGALTLLIFLLLPAILNLFSLSEETWHLSYQLILAHNLMATALHPTAFNLANGLRAAGDARYTMFVGIGSMLLFRLGTAALLGAGLGLGVYGVWAAMGMDWLGRSIAFVLRFRSGKWRGRRAI